MGQSPPPPAPSAPSSPEPTPAPSTVAPHDVSDLPAPAPAPVAGPASVPYGARPGSLTFAWRAMLGIVWGAVVFAFAAVWQASVQIGIATWWLGPRSDPNPTLVRLLPFIVGLIVLAAIAYDVRRLLTVSGVASALVVIGGLADMDRSVGLGITEIAIGAAAAVTTLAASTGRYRVASSIEGADGVDRTDSPAPHDSPTAPAPAPPILPAPPPEPPRSNGG